MAHTLHHKSDCRPSYTKQNEKARHSFFFLASQHDQLHTSTSRRGKPRKAFVSSVTHGGSSMGLDAVFAETSLTGVLPR